METEAALPSWGSWEQENNLGVYFKLRTLPMESSPILPGWMHWCDLDSLPCPFFSLFSSWSFSPNFLAYEIKSYHLTPIKSPVLFDTQKLCHEGHQCLMSYSLVRLSFVPLNVTFCGLSVFYLYSGFPDGTVVKNPSANAGDAGDAGWIPGSGGPGVANGK